MQVDDNVDGDGGDDDDKEEEELSLYSGLEKWARYDQIWIVLAPSYKHTTIQM